MKQRRVGVIGAGRSGLAAARLLCRLGARVLLSDSGAGRPAASLPKAVTVETGGHSNRLLECDLLIRSPGVSGHLPVLRRAARLGIPIWSELELGSRVSRSRRVVAITGTNGKTTTTTLVGKFFTAGGERTWVAGNIGKPLSDVAAKTSPRSTLVLEVSSYQLENVETFHPTISAILNVTPDHLEHHGSLRAYAEAKARIFMNQTARDVCVLNADDAWCRRLAKRCKAKVLWFSRKRRLTRGIYWEPEDGTLHLRWGSHQRSWPLHTGLPGPHNIENVLAAVGMAAAGGVCVPAMRRVLSAFRGVEHRLEFVRTLRQVRYVNDSKGTNVDSTRVALASFPGPLIVIMGGEGKGAPYAPLKSLLKGRVRRILLIGEDARRIEKQLRGAVPMERLDTLAKAVRRAHQLALPGETVLLSPACASFDQYDNYEERGGHFKSLVRRL